MSIEANLNITLALDQDDNKVKKAVKKAQTKKAQASYVPTWSEQWFDGWVSHTGVRKKGIYQHSLSDTDKKRVDMVRQALESGELVRQESKAVITKAEVLRLFPALVESRRQEILLTMTRNTPNNYFIIERRDQFKEFYDLLFTESIVALDTETNGLDCHGESQIVGLCFTLPIIDRHYYIPLYHDLQIQEQGKQAVTEWRQYVFSALKAWFEDYRHRKILHNARFDAHMLRQHDIYLRGIHWDTQLAMKILNENEESVALKKLANKYGHLFGYEDISYTYAELFGDNTPFNEVDYRKGGAYYAAKDGQLTYLLFRWQEQQFDRLPKLNYVYRQIENPLIEATITMERTGFLIDLEYAETFGNQLKEQISENYKKLRAAFGVNDSFNFDSNQQLANLLYNELGLTDKENGSVEASVLSYIKNEHEGIAYILEHRSLAKLFGTYVEALPAQIKKDGRLRGSFNQTGTVTGRFSSDKPNLQNLPIEGRRLIIAPKGKIIIGSDYSQIEPRVLAHISGDKDLQAVYLQGVDLYSTLASKVFKVPFEECLDGSKYRKRMKMILLGVMYGLSAYSLAETLGVEVSEAQQFIDDFYEAYPKVYEWIKSIHEFVKKHEYVETLSGRKRRFPKHREKAILYDKYAAEIKAILGVDKLPMNIWEEDFKRKGQGLPPLLPYKLKRAFQDVKSEVERVRRMAVNAIIQGTAADIMKLALIGLQEYTQTKGWSLNGTVHDEVLSQVDDTITLAEIEEMESIMTNVIKLDVPLKVDTDIYCRWGDNISKKEWFKL